MISVRTVTEEAIFQVSTGAPIVTRIWVTVIHVNITTISCISWLAATHKVIQTILTCCSIYTGVVFTVVKIHFTVFTSSSPRTSTFVSRSICNSVTSSTIFTRLGLAFINVRFAVGACVPLRTHTLVVPQEIPAGAPIAACNTPTVINVSFTSVSLVPMCTGTSICINFVFAGCPILAWIASTFINVDLTCCSLKTWWTGTLKFIGQVFTHASILTGAGLTLIDIFFTNCSCVSWHTYTSEHPGQIQTGSLILAGVGLTLVYVRFTAWSGESINTVTLKAARGVNASPSMLTWGHRTFMALIDIHRAVISSPAFLTRADRVSINWGGFTTSPFMTRATCACIFQMTAQACFSVRTVAVVVPHFVVTRSPVITRVVLTVVDVDAAVPPRPSVDTDTRIVSHRVVQTCCSIFTNIGIKSAFIHILLTELSCQGRGTSTGVRVDLVHTS